MAVHDRLVAGEVPAEREVRKAVVGVQGRPLDRRASPGTARSVFADTSGTCVGAHVPPAPPAHAQHASSARACRDGRSSSCRRRTSRRSPAPCLRRRWAQRRGDRWRASWSRPCYPSRAPPGRCSASPRATPSTRRSSAPACRAETRRTRARTRSAANSFAARLLRQGKTLKEVQEAGGWSKKSYRLLAEDRWPSAIANRRHSSFR